jgi:hypothetical protein
MRPNPSVLLVGVLLVASACTWFRPEPLYIKFPVPPHITYELCDVVGRPEPELCLSQSEAAALSKWMDKVRAFEAARERLTRD